MTFEGALISKEDRFVCTRRMNMATNHSDKPIPHEIWKHLIDGLREGRRPEALTPEDRKEISDAVRKAVSKAFDRASHSTSGRG